MRSFKKILFPFLFFLFSLNSLAQDVAIDSLKKVLSSLRDTARINCLNHLSYQFIVAEKKDSAEHYARIADSESRKLNYAHGIAVSLSNQCQIAKHFDDDFVKTEKLGKESLQWFEKTANKDGLYNLYEYLWYTVFSQSKFDEALVYAEKMLELARQSGDQSKIINGLIGIFAINRQSGNYEQAFSFLQQAHELALQAKHKIWISNTRYCMAQLYELIEDYQEALTYFRKVIETDDEETRNERIKTDNDIWFKMEFTEAFVHLNQFDSAWHYYNLFRPPKDKAVYLRVYWISTGECYLRQKNYTRALQNFQLGLSEHQKLNDRNEVMRSLLDISKTYLALGNNSEALKYGREGLDIAIQTKAKQFIRDGYQVLSIIYDRYHQIDSANFYFKNYVIMKDSVLDNQARAKFAAYSYEQKIALINKEKEIHKVKLEKESFIKNILIAGIFILLLFGVFIVRSISLRRKNEKQHLKHEIELQKLEAEKEKAELQQKSAELEMQALRAQMNPHFIFNSLNSINRFILQNNRLDASEYLVKFSRLVRLILQNSKSPLITLDSELEAMNLYLQLESLRVDNHFEYKIIVDKELDTHAIKIPPLIIQPYVENAIWHGLMHREEKGQLEIELYEEQEILCCKVTDNGVGRKKASELKSQQPVDHKSMGMQITTSRIELHQKQKSNAEHVIVTDLVSPGGEVCGTEVLLKIPINYD